MHANTGSFFNGILKFIMLFFLLQLSVLQGADAAIVSVSTARQVYVDGEPVYILYQLQGLEAGYPVNLSVNLQMPDGTICFLGPDLRFSPLNPIWLVQGFPFAPVRIDDGALPLMLDQSLVMAPGEYSITAEVYDAAASRLIARDQSGFFLVNAPYVDHVEPSQGITGDIVRIHGEMFGTNQDLVKVLIGGREATIMEISPQTIVVWVPYGATTGKVTVAVDGALSNPVDFLVGPYIEELSKSVLEPGGKLLIKGFNFDEDTNRNYVYFNGIRGTVTKASSTQLEVLVPDGNTGPLSVKVNGMESNARPVTITPVVESLTPSTGNVDDTITISGWNFNPVATNNYVVFNAGSDDEVAATVLEASSTQLVVRAPAAETGVVEIYTDGQKAGGDVAFTYPPLVSQVTPGEVMAGDSIEITGLNFEDVEQRNTVTVGGVTLTVTSATAHEITARTPLNLSSGTVEVTVNGLKSSEAEFLSVYPAPVISSVSPSSLEAGDTSSYITVTGIGFVSGVKITLDGPAGTLAPSVSVGDYNTVKFKIPRGASPGTYTVTAIRHIAGRTLESNSYSITLR